MASEEEPKVNVLISEGKVKVVQDNVKVSEEKVKKELEPVKSTVENQTFLQSFWSQLVIMMRRNTILQYRYLNATLAQVVISPFIFTLLIFILQIADHSNQKRSNPHPTLGALDGILRCQVN